MFVNGRFAFHRPELADLLAVRSALIGRRPPNDAPELDEVSRVCDARNVGFLTYAARSRLDAVAVGALLQDEDRWALWHLDGRFAVYGRAGVVDREVASRLRYDPVRLAFGLEQEPLPEGKSLQPLRGTEDPWDAFWDDYLARPEPIPPEADDAEMLDGYNDYLRVRSEQRWGQKARTATAVGAAALTGVMAGAGWLQANPQPVEDARLALPVLLGRVARRAVAASPDRPGVYRALSTAYSQQYTPTTSLPLDAVQMTEQQIQVLTALARYLARVPPPERCSPAMKREAFRAAMRLSGLYRQTGQLDLCREVFGRVVRLADSLPPEELREFVQPGPKVDESIKAFLKSLKDEEDNLARLVQQHSLFVERQTTPTARFWSAANEWPPGRPAGRLPGKAIEVFKSASGPNEFGTGDAQLQVVLQLIALELRAGRLEDAAADLDALDDEIKRLASTQPNSPVTTAFRRCKGSRPGWRGTSRPPPRPCPGPPRRWSRSSRTRSSICRSSTPGWAIPG